MTPDECATYLGVTRRTIDRRIADGTLTAHKFGPRLVRIHHDDAEAAVRAIGAST